MTGDYFEPGAFESWIPRLVDIAKRHDDGEPGYENVGFEALVVPEELTQLTDRWPTLKVRFEERYAFRMINSETLERWQMRLQNRLDEIADRYERAYALYALYEDEMMDDVLEGWSETSKSTDSGSESLWKLGTEKDTIAGSEELAYSGSQKTTEGGNDTTEGLRSDTPDSAINTGGAYADMSQNGKTTYGHTAEDTFTDRKDTRTYKDRENTRSFTDREDKKDFGKIVDTDITRIITGASIIDNVNASIRKWEDIDTRFVAEFENLFLNVFWY